jgi:ABC-type phosphate transport system auxiliary subunit
LTGLPDHELPLDVGGIELEEEKVIAVLENLVLREDNPKAPAVLTRSRGGPLLALNHHLNRLRGSVVEGDSTKEEESESENREDGVLHDDCS